MGHVTSAFHLENEVAIESVGPGHPQYDQWQLWKEDVELTNNLQDALAQQTKQGQSLRDRYDSRRQVLQGSLHNHLSSWNPAEGLLKDDFEFEDPVKSPSLPDTDLVHPPCSESPTGDLEKPGSGACARSDDCIMGLQDPQLEESMFCHQFDETLYTKLNKELDAENNAGQGGVPKPSIRDPALDAASPFDQPSSWFTPYRNENMAIDYLPDNEWYAFETEIFAHLFVFVNCRTNPLSRQQLLRVWDLLNRFLAVPVPAFSTVMDFGKSIPRPRTYQMETAESIPKTYSQISITDLIRMQLAIPETHNLLQEHSIQIRRTPHAGIASTPLSDGELPRVIDERRELWTGSKWYSIPNLQPPNVVLENGIEAGFGMILEFPADTACHSETPPSIQASNCRFGVFCGQSLLDFVGLFALPCSFRSPFVDSTCSLYGRLVRAAIQLLLVN